MNINKKNKKFDMQKSESVRKEIRIKARKKF